MSGKLRTKKGNVTAAARHKHGVGKEGKWPIFDKKSALSAIKLRGHAESSAQRAAIIARAAAYAPEAAKKAREEDKKK
jgi:hypothetical protein